MNRGKVIDVLGLGRRVKEGEDGLVEPGEKLCQKYIPYKVGTLYSLHGKDRGPGWLYSVLKSWYSRKVCLKCRVYCIHSRNSGHTLKGVVCKHERWISWVVSREETSQVIFFCRDYCLIEVLGPSNVFHGLIIIKFHYHYYHQQSSL